VKALLVGTGSIGRRHLGNLRTLGVRDILILRSRRTPSLIPPEEMAGTRVFYDLDEALTEGPEVAIIANPTSKHLGPATAAARRGCHLFIEKPISHSLDQLSPLMEAVDARGLITQVGYNMRFHPALETVRTLLQEGEIGKVYGVEAWSAQYLPDWHPWEDYRGGYMTRRALGGGIVLTYTHELDYLYWMCGPVRSVTAEVDHLSSLEMDTDDIAEINLRFRSGVVGHVHLDCIERTHRRGGRAVGEAGTVRWDLQDNVIEMARGGSSKWTPTEFPDFQRNDMYLWEMEDFLRCVQSGTRKTRVPLQEGLVGLRIAVASLDSSERGERVLL
jgi:predicted dehydrogenase